MRSFDPDTVPWRTTSWPGIAVRFLCRDEASGDSVVLIRMDPGRGYPPHRHVGDEEVFVLAGGYRDARGTYRAGEFVTNAAGTSHHPVALEGDTPCVLFAIAHGGIEILDPQE
jgi:anti-sigma factor ChrR (cupin superfamily)